MDFTIRFNDDYIRRVIAQYQCDSFLIAINMKGNFATCGVYEVTKEEFFDTGIKLFRHFGNSKDFVSSNEEMKRVSDANKPCLRLDYNLIRDTRALYRYEGKPIKFEHKDQPNHEKWLKSLRTNALRHSAGCAIEAMIASETGMTQIGENDRKSHIFHCDLLDEKNQRAHEVKLQTGFLMDVFASTKQIWG